MHDTCVPGGACSRFWRIPHPPSLSAAGGWMLVRCRTAVCVCVCAEVPEGASGTSKPTPAPTSYCALRPSATQPEVAWLRIGLGIRAMKR